MNLRILTVIVSLLVPTIVNAGSAISDFKNTTIVSLSANTEVSGSTFNAGASAFTIQQ